MRVSTVVILLVGMLVFWENQKALANSELNSILDTNTENMSIEPSTYSAEVGEKIVKDIQIRFVNDKGKLVDDKGQLIEGRTQKDFIIGNLKLKVGQVFREDVFQEDLQRLRRLKSFDKVKVSLEEDATGINIIYDIQERRFPSLNFGGGNSSDYGLYGRVGYEDSNISGLGDRLNASVQLTREDIQFDSHLTSPYRRGEPNRFGYSVRAFRQRDLSRTFNDDIKLANGDRVREGRFGGSVAVLGAVNDWDTALALNYTRISLRDRDYKLARVDRLGNPLSVSGTGIDDLITVSFAVTKDKRDRLDNPTQGSILSLSTSQAIPIGLGKISTNRLVGNYIQYVPVSWIGKGRQTENPEMLAFNVQLGTIIGEFPPADAFDIGGMNSVRGYGSGKVASGRSYGLASVEYRFPILQTVGGVVFADFASDFGSGKTVLGEPGVVRGKPGSGFGYGLGLRVKSPIGLIRGDLGISNEGEVRFEITTGQRF
ncbi:MAG: BamA/TamA family outer membrane protein [Heteroscytonema crispum UTEX LB 1556]